MPCLPSTMIGSWSTDTMQIILNNIFFFKTKLIINFKNVYAFFKSQWQCTQWTEYIFSNFSVTAVLNGCVMNQTSKKDDSWVSTLSIYILQYSIWIIYLWFRITTQILYFMREITHTVWSLYNIHWPWNQCIICTVMPCNLLFCGCRPGGGSTTY